MLRQAAPSLLAIITALVGCFLALVATNSFAVALEAFGAMAVGAFGDWLRAFEQDDWAPVLRPLGESGSKAALLTLTGLSVAVASRVGLFNIGAQGQLTVGAFTAAVVGTVAMPSAIHLACCVLAAALAGAIWALGPAILKVKRGVHEVISTIMLNWVALNFVDNWLVVGPFSARTQTDDSVAGTAQVLPTATLPRLLGDDSRLNFGLVLALVATVALYVFLSRTVRGFRWRVVGLQPEAGRAAGINVERTIVEAMLTSGALAGVAGAVLVLGTELKYPSTIGAPYGFDGIAMALIGQGNPLGVAASSAFFGALRAGGTRMQLAGVHKSFPELIQGVALVLVAAKVVWERLLPPRGAR